jgi:sugar (pentulose or hexulose) kinase
MMKSFLSIDVGTSSTKLSLYDAGGRMLAACSASYALEIPRPGWAEQDPQEWWRAVCRLGPEIMAGLGGHDLAAICVSGQTPLCVPLGTDGLPLRTAIVWLDRRATPQVAWLVNNLGEERCRQVGANRLDSYFGGAKWLWFCQEEPELYERTWKILQANGYVAWKLTGQAVIDPSQAGLCSPCYDFTAGTWQAEVCAGMGLDLDKLPRIVPSQAVIGRVLPEAARACGLPAGTPVVCGGGDFACACLGAGVTGPGTAALMLGTAGNLLFPGVFNPDPRLLHTRHVTGQPLTFGGVLAGGNLSWLAELFDEPPIDFYTRQDEAAAQLPPGSDGLVYLPYLMGERTPIWDPEARGAFVGLSSRHTRAHLYRAVLEGVAFAFRQVLEITGTTGLGAIVAIDGGARSAVWRSILASVLGIPLRRGSLRAGTGLGAAFLAALGVGEATSFAEIEGWGETSEPVLPDPEAGRRYDQLYAIYAGLYPKLKPDFAFLARPQDKKSGLIGRGTA